MAREREEFRLRLAQKDDEIAELRLTLEEQMQEYSDLLDIKIRLDREIDAYRKLLESEETRSVVLSLCYIDSLVDVHSGICVNQNKGALALLVIGT